MSQPVYSWLLYFYTIKSLSLHKPWSKSEVKEEFDFRISLMKAAPSSPILCSVQISITFLFTIWYVATHPQDQVQSMVQKQKYHRVFLCHNANCLFSVIFGFFFSLNSNPNGIKLYFGQLLTFICQWTNPNMKEFSLYFGLI